jgi:hypothetical protein
VAAGVNPDASLFCRAPGSDLGARHGGVAPHDHADSADRRTGPRGAGCAERTPRHNKSGHGRSSCRSRPASDSLRKETTALTLPRHETPMVDERHDCQDIGPAYVPGTVWGTASSQTGKFRSRRRACRLIPTSRRRVSHSGVHRRTGGDQRDAITPSISDTPSGRIESGKPTSLQTVRRRAPDKRGSGQPSTRSDLLLVYRRDELVARRKVAVKRGDTDVRLACDLLQAGGCAFFGKDALSRRDQLSSVALAVGAWSPRWLGSGPLLHVR